MNGYFASIFLTIASNVGYHFFQREINPEAPPLLSLAASYLVGLFVTIVALVMTPGLNGSAGLRGFDKVGWASYALGFALVGLELGFLFAYRSGWKLSLAALYSNIGVTLVLIPIGMLAYREELSASKISGIACSLLGLWLLGKK